MSTDCNKHSHHDHEHSPECGHTRIKHDDHTDYVHDGHLHHKHGEHWDECKIPVSDKNPDECHPVDTDCDHSEDCDHRVALVHAHTVITPITLLTVVCTTNMVITSMTTDRLTSLKTNLQLG